MAMHDLWAQKLAALVCALFLFGATPPARAEDDATEFLERLRAAAFQTLRPNTFLEASRAERRSES